VFQSLDSLGIRFRRGQLGLIAAGPGTGKSAFTLTYALKSLVPSLYFSADSDAFTQLCRSICILCGWSMEQAANAVLSDGLVDAVNALTGLPIRFNYSASPGLGDIERSVEAYEELYGDYPSLIVVDNITNVRNEMSAAEDGDPFGGLEGLMDYLHTMARETQACTLGLHHVTGPYNDANKPIPLSGVKGQIMRVPELGLTIHRRPGDEWTTDRIGVSPVKNRGGKADPTGETFAELEFIGDQMLIRDPVLTRSGVEARARVTEHVEETFPDLEPGTDPFGES
jgi:hypothetical protein